MQTIFELTISGAGGHSSAPHKTKNPVVIGAGLIRAFEEALWYGVDSFARIPVTVLRFEAGERGNIIPEQGVVVFAAECETQEQERAVEEKLRVCARAMELQWGITCEQKIRSGFPD